MQYVHTLSLLISSHSNSFQLPTIKIIIREIYLEKRESFLQKKIEYTLSADSVKIAKDWLGKLKRETHPTGLMISSKIYR